MLVRPDDAQLKDFEELIPFRARELSKYFEVGSAGAGWRLLGGAGLVGGRLYVSAAAAAVGAAAVIDGVALL